MAISYSLVPSNDGVNHFGGETPGEFNIPENNCPGSFQYLGMLNNNDPAFSWLPCCIHLTCPVYMNIDKVWLDYSDPNHPTIINLNEINELDTAYDDLKTDSVITYEKVKFNSRLINADDRGRLGLAGVPRWIQNEGVPTCPKTNSEMKFLCQIEYVFEPEVKVQYTNVINEEVWYKRYFETMNFWGDGDLYVYFEPTSKIACYFIQKT